jgi:glycosyltransferase involved in cell wall biosynthesis
MPAAITIDQKSSNCRILVICNDADYFLRHRLSVVSYLSSVGAHVSVIAGGNPIPANRVQGWKYTQVRIERFKFDPISDLALMVRTARTIWDLKPDAIHLITLKPMIFSGAAAIASRLFLGYPKRVLITLPGLGRMMSRTKEPGGRRYPLGKALTLFASRTLARFDCVHFTFETKYDYDFWEKCGIADSKNSTVIEGAGVDPKLFYPSNVLRNTSKKKVIFASRTLKSKGLNAFLQMAHQLSNRIDVEFLVAGIADDKDPDAISSDYLAKLSEIRFLGRVEDMAPLLRECDIVCLPSRYGEGIPRILIEAAATGLASIVTSHPGCLEVVEDGVSGKILHTSTDADMSREMATAVIKYLESPDILRMHSENAYRHFLSREFKQDRIDTRFAELLGVHSNPLSHD